MNEYDFCDGSRDPVSRTLNCHVRATVLLSTRDLNLATDYPRRRRPSTGWLHPRHVKSSAYSKRDRLDPYILKESGCLQVVRSCRHLVAGTALPFITGSVHVTMTSNAVTDVAGASGLETGVCELGWVLTRAIVENAALPIKPALAPVEMKIDRLVVNPS